MREDANGLIILAFSTMVALKTHLLLFHLLPLACLKAVLIVLSGRHVREAMLVMARVGY
jgi:hypothetical protein